MFPALVAAEGENRQFVLHVKHLAVGQTWNGKNEGDWLGKAVFPLSDIISHGAAGMQVALPITRKQVRVGTATLHAFAVALRVDHHSFNTDVRCFASDSPSWAPLPAKQRQIESWPLWRCMVAESKSGSTASFCHVHVGPEEALLVMAATASRPQACKWLHKDETLGARVQSGGGAHHPCVVVSVLTVPSTSSPETGESRLEMYRLYAFQDRAHAVLSGDLCLQTATSCCSSIQRISRLRAPLNRTLNARRLVVLVNPTSGHKMGAKLWDMVEPLLSMAEVDYEVTMTAYAGHASHVVAQLELESCSRLLVVGGDGTVLEVLNALIARPDAAQQPLPVATIPAGSECAFAKMTTYLHVYAACWVVLKGHRASRIDAMRVMQGDASMHALCGVGWGLAGKLAEESEELREAFGPARYLVSGLKGLIKLEGCACQLEILVPTAPDPPPSSTTPCRFGSACDICEAAAATGDGAEGECAAEWQTLKGEFVMVALLKGTKRLAPCVHLADGLVDVVAIPKSEHMDHLQLIKSSYHYLRDADLAARGRASGQGRQQDECSFVIRKALAVRLVPADERHKFNIDGEVHDGKPMEVRVLPRAFSCCLASRPADCSNPHTASHLETAKHDALEAAERAGRHALDLAQPLLVKGQDKGKQLLHEIHSAAARAAAAAADSSTAQAVRGASGALQSLRLL